MGLNYFFYNILPTRLSLEINKFHSETKNAQCTLNVNCCLFTVVYFFENGLFLIISIYSIK